MKTVINQGLRELSGNGFFPGGQGAGASTIALVPLQKSITLQTALATTIDSYINQGNCFLGITNNGHTQVVKVLNKNKVTPGTTYFLDQPLSELFIEDVFDVAVFGEPKFQYEKIEV
ncbi:MAG TPA: hypothetical protein PLJ00_05895, partial [Chitinophagales bacterium]|nr:hypothetical protein [Chitinophagales bacterium]